MAWSDQLRATNPISRAGASHLELQGQGQPAHDGHPDHQPAGGVGQNDEQLEPEISPAAFRKRLQDARDRLRSFMQGHCGLVNPANACRCRRRVQRAVELGRVDPHDLLFVGRPTSQPAAARRLLAEGVEQMERLHAAADELYRSAPWQAAPPTLPQRVLQLVTRSGPPLLSPPPT